MFLCFNRAGVVIMSSSCNHHVMYGRHLQDHRPCRPLHLYNTGTGHVGFFPTRQRSRAPSAKRRDVFSRGGGLIVQVYFTLWLVLDSDFSNPVPGMAKLTYLSTSHNFARWWVLISAKHVIIVSKFAFHGLSHNHPKHWHTASLFLFFFRKQSVPGTPRHYCRKFSTH